MRIAASIFASILTGAACASIAVAGCDTGVDTDVVNPLDGGSADVTVILDGGGDPAIPPDGVAACPQGICNYQSGLGCPQGTPACIPALDGMGGVAPACQPAGTAKTGEACAQFTDCAAGFLCVLGACKKLCCGGDWTGCPTAGEHCLTSLVYDNGMGGTLQTGAMLCETVNNCDALVPSSCGGKGVCQIADATGATACLPEGSGQSGDPCPCKGGFTCQTPNDASPRCVRLCKAVEGGGEPFCKPGEGICTHFVRDPPGVGECTQ